MAADSIFAAACSSPALASTSAVVIRSMTRHCGVGGPSPAAKRSVRSTALPVRPVASRPRRRTSRTVKSSVPDPPGLLLLACQQPADEGGATLVADGARIIGTLASQHRDALAALYAPRAAFFGTAGGHLGPVCEPAGAQRTSLRFRLDDLAWFSSGATAAIPLLRAVIGQHVETFRLQRGEGLILSNTRWLHGRERYAGHRIMLRILGDPLPGTGIMPGFRSPSPAPGAQTPRAA